ncbi:hypothetical protein GGR50DRAFT_696122 [Xylaria sp. CBS 124048]|nr:hypothetical protein GGR50DRAFT_696122 [Xylaria sp. CBS 124048]
MPPIRIIRDVVLARDVGVAAIRNNMRTAQPAVVSTNPDASVDDVITITVLAVAVAGLTIILIVIGIRKYSGRDRVLDVEDGVQNSETEEAVPLEDMAPPQEGNLYPNVDEPDFSVESLPRRRTLTAQNMALCSNPPSQIDLNAAERGFRSASLDNMAGSATPSIISLSDGGQSAQTEPSDMGRRSASPGPSNVPRPSRSHHIGSRRHGMVFDWDADTPSPLLQNDDAMAQLLGVEDEAMMSGALTQGRNRRARLLQRSENLPPNTIREENEAEVPENHQSIQDESASGGENGGENEPDGEAAVSDTVHGHDERGNDEDHEDHGEGGVGGMVNGDGEDGHHDGGMVNGDGEAGHHDGGMANGGGEGGHHDGGMANGGGEADYYDGSMVNGNDVATDHDENAANRGNDDNNFEGAIFFTASPTATGLDAADAHDNGPASQGEANVAASHQQQASDHRRFSWSDWTYDPNDPKYNVEAAVLATRRGPSRIPVATASATGGSTNTVPDGNINSQYAVLNREYTRASLVPEPLNIRKSVGVQESSAVPVLTTATGDDTVVEMPSSLPHPVDSPAVERPSFISGHPSQTPTATNDDSSHEAQALTEWKAKALAEVRMKAAQAGEVLTEDELGRRVDVMLQRSHFYTLPSTRYEPPTPAAREATQPRNRRVQTGQEARTEAVPAAESALASGSAGRRSRSGSVYGTVNRDLRPLRAAPRPPLAATSQLEPRAHHRPMRGNSSRGGSGSLYQAARGNRTARQESSGASSSGPASYDPPTGLFPAANSDDRTVRMEPAFASSQVLPLAATLASIDAQDGSHSSSSPPSPAGDSASARQGGRIPRSHQEPDLSRYL